MSKSMHFNWILLILVGLNAVVNAKNIYVKGRIILLNEVGVNRVRVTAQKSEVTVISDSLGFYEITCAEDDKLTFEANGFIKEKINLKRIEASDSLNIDLKPENSEKSKQLATGYGHIDRDKITHAIERAETINDYSEYSSVLDIIRGKVSGVQIAGNSITIRGADTYNDQEPLIVVDGTVVDFTALNNISTSQVKSVDFLKGASASARYGSRGMQGVIVIQTKKKN